MALAESAVLVILHHSHLREFLPYDIRSAVSGHIVRYYQPEIQITGLLQNGSDHFFYLVRIIIGNYAACGFGACIHLYAFLIIVCSCTPQAVCAHTF